MDNFQEHLSRLDDEWVKQAFKEFTQLRGISGFPDIHLVYMTDIIAEANKRALNILDL